MVAIIYVSGQCNQNCIFCCGQYKSKIQFIESKILDPKIDDLIISGGEPLLADNIFDILRLCKKNPNIKRVEFQSNGALFFYEDIIHKINSYQIVTEYNINFPSWNELMDSRQTRSSFFKYRLAGVKNLQKNRCSVRLTYVINRDNYKEMVPFLKFTRDQFAPGLQIQFTFMQHTRNKSNWSLIPRYAQIKEFVNEAASFAQDVKINCLFENIPLCIMYPFYKRSVDYNKSIIDKNSIERKRKIRQCRTCLFNSCCLGIPLYYIKFFGTSEIVPVILQKKMSHD